MISTESKLRSLLGEQATYYFGERITASLGYWGERILSQLLYAHELSRQADGLYDSLIAETLEWIESRREEEGGISKQAALEGEQRLHPMAEAAKQYKVICVAHAHIDMNWMWPWHETVAVTIDTIRTMLQLLAEYPDFHFSQSQAAIYSIIEEYAPEMLDEIRLRVDEGRWEVSASHWVEADKNMPSGESLTRQIMYAKRYLSELLGVAPSSMDLDFEPDTFGHSAHVPEILRNGGVNYYYHCRGSEGPVLYRWESPSGSSVIAYREPTWYNDSVQPVLGAYVPEICRTTGLDTHLHVYGVGDHGGGPTRRDLDAMIDMQGWPIYPELRFGTYREFFQLAERHADRLPVVKGEQNFVFTGCYTSQSRIKTANRVGEATLYEAELFSSIAALEEGAAYPAPALAQAWRNQLFNQFHDILPGSGVIDTREHALGLFQQTFAIANTRRKRAMELIADNIDTSSLAEVAVRVSSSAMGAGAGYGSGSFKVSQSERGGGTSRIIHVFNPSLHDRRELIEAVLWDWASPIAAVSARDTDGNAVACQVLERGRHAYWSHDYMRLLIDVHVPACGYNTYVIGEGEGDARALLPSEPRLDRPPSYVLENDLLRAEFCSRTGGLCSLLHKPSGRQMVEPGQPAGLFRLITEDAGKGMTAWWIGRYMAVEELHDKVKIKPVRMGDLRQTIQYEIRRGQTKLRVAVSLDKGGSSLQYEIQCDWQETGGADQGVPQLSFYWPLAYDADHFIYDVPSGTMARPAMDDDVPANSWAFAVPFATGLSEPPPGIQMITRHKYGFRAAARSLSLTLIRGSFDPDPYPETGDHHQTSFSVAVTESGDIPGLTDRAGSFNHPLSVVSGVVHTGTRPASHSFVRLKGGTAALSAVKMAEDGKGDRWFVRMYEMEGAETRVKLELPKEVDAARFADSNEVCEELQEPSMVCEGNMLSFVLPPYALRTIMIDFAAAKVAVSG